MNWLIDDAHLGVYLRTGRRPSGFRARDRLYTSGYWYVRLCQAMLGVAQRGVLSGPLDALPPAQSQKVLAAVVALPEEVGLLSLRELGPAIGRLRQTYPLHALSSEALAAASVLGAKVLLSVASPKLEAALAAEGLRVTQQAPE